MRALIIGGIVTAAAAAGVVGWLGVQYRHQAQDQQRQEQFLQAARQGAINLTTIDFAEADADVQRIVDGATGPFYDDFQKRAQPFVGVVKQAKSKSIGTVTAAGLASVQGDEAQALVTVSVNTTNAGAAEQKPRLWRMRIDMQRVNDVVKVSNVSFVP
ncbi:mammalian cell entry protein [Mycobacterium sp. SMC-18]|uniref:mammalian cell entry protein n=1 Tax=unclassified Mycobacterium TaxID=2642494 RepID=UPI003876DFBA